MPKKINEIESCKVSMSIKNRRRWVSLKNHLGFFTDDELIDYLLDLADSMIDQQGKNFHRNAETNGVRCSQESDVESSLAQSLDSRISYSKSNRRSSRKLNADEKPKNVSSSLHNIEQLVPKESGACSKSLEKTKFHKSKHRKRKHQKKRMILKENLDLFDENVIKNNGNRFYKDLENDTVQQSLAENTDASKKTRCSNRQKEMHKKSLESNTEPVNIGKVDGDFWKDKDSCQLKVSKQVYLTDQSLSVCDNYGNRNVDEGTEVTSSLNVSGISQNDTALCTHTDVEVSTLADEYDADGIEMNTTQQELLPTIEAHKNCDVRHFQDSCPLDEPEHLVQDSILLSNWINRHKNNSEVAKVTDSRDPMSKGYSMFEARDDLAKQYKAKCDLQCEEKKEEIHPNWPLFSRESLPVCLELKMTNMDHGLGVFTRNLVPIDTHFGPLIGKSVHEKDIPDDYSMRHIWEVSSDDSTHYISTTNPLASNWIRYIRPAETKDSKTVSFVTKNGQVFFITCKTLTAGTELTYWLDSQSNSWTRKRRMDKTNCGGCNLKFSHPIYYRLHCSIFHDTNYSLTIRKYHCKVCGTAVLGKDNIMKHAAQFHAGRGAYQCQYCRKFFLRLNYLEMHRTYGCSRNPSRSRPLCDFCGRKFCQPQKLKVHIKRMHSDTSEVLEEFQCKLCSKLLGSRAALARHMKEVHHKDVVGAAACDRCGKTFQNKSNLKIHMLTHSGVKPFKCREKECRAAFTTKQCLQFHYKKVHGLSDEMMPKIERSIAYTFDAYSGGVVDDHGKELGQTEEASRKSLDLEDDSEESVILESSSNLENTSRTVVKQASLNDKNKLEIVEPSTESFEKNSDAREVESSATLASEAFNIDSIQNNGQESNKAPSYQISSNDEQKHESTCSKRQESYNASLLVEAALDAAERDIGVVSIPPLENNEQGNADLYSVPHELGFKSVDYQVAHEATGGNIDAYVHDELVESCTATPNCRQALPIITPQYRSNGYVSNRLHSIEQYLEQDISTSPRYEEMIHIVSSKNSQMQSQSHRLTIDPASSDESDSAVQNLSLPLKDRSIQQMETPRYNYEPDYNSARVKFEPLVVQQSAREQGLDMSARGFQQTCEPQEQNSSHLAHYHHHHHHHHHHPFEMDENERQGVDLSISGPCASPTYATYSHVDVSPRVVNLEPRSHQLDTAVSRIIASPLPGSLLTSFSPEGAIIPSSASPIPTYSTATCSIGTYHTARSGYHYYY